jgi:hypothetical protein
MSAAKVDEDDPVVRELPVYLSLELASQLYLLQYPLRSADRPYSDDGGGPPVSAIFNPFTFLQSNSIISSLPHGSPSLWARGCVALGRRERLRVKHDSTIGVHVVALRLAGCCASLLPHVGVHIPFGLSMCTAPPDCHAACMPPPHTATGRAHVCVVLPTTALCALRSRCESSPSSRRSSSPFRSTRQVSTTILLRAAPSPQPLWTKMEGMTMTTTMATAG